MNDQPHSHDEPGRTPPPETPIDPGSHALSEALRSSFGIVKVVMFILVIVFLCSGFFTVEQQQRAIILRFGKPVGEGEKALLGPGLHWSFPYPIDEYQLVSITGIQSVHSTVGWYYTTPEQEQAGTEGYAGKSLNPAVDGYLITGDTNIIHSRATLNYRINDPIRYVFGFVNASNVVQDALDHALVYTAAHYKVDDILTRDVSGFQDAVRKRATELVEKQNVGVTVENCIVRDRIPPRQVKGAFVNVLRAEVQRSTFLNDAASYSHRVLNEADATARAHINRAESERVLLVNEITSQAERFKEILPRYEANPELFRQKTLTEMFSRVMTNVQEKIFLSSGGSGKSRTLWLQLHRELPKSETEKTQGNVSPLK